MSANEPVPEPPWRKPPRKPTRREPLTREAIVATALALLNREGLAAVTMRRVAEELNTGAASLYWHVQDKEEILDLLLDAIASEVPLPEPHPQKWQEQLKEMGRASRRILKAHNDAARLSIGRIPVGPNLLRVTEWLLAVMGAGGISGRAAAWSAQLFFLYIGAFTFDEISAPPVAESPADAAAEFAPMESYLSSLPINSFPNLVALAGDLSNPDADARFELGLEVLVGGLAGLMADDIESPASDQK